MPGQGDGSQGHTERSLSWGHAGLSRKGPEWLTSRGSSVVMLTATLQRTGQKLQGTQSHLPLERQREETMTVLPREA